MTVTAEDVYALAPFVRTLGVEFDRIAPERVVARLAHSVALSTTGGGLHGGAVMALADATAAVCAAMNGQPGVLPATADSTTHFLRPIADVATATAVPLRVSARQVVITVEVRDDAGVVCAHVVQTVRLISDRG
ncbi:PaaI family thioesterase [Nocardia asiatica]|uniref:PaaI family thioesterase n=1 Tax=Nocardia asiatica TaxID=209252 RepID=UPI003EDF7679